MFQKSKVSPLLPFSCSIFAAEVVDSERRSLLPGFSLLAVLLASLGIYGVGTPTFALMVVLLAGVALIAGYLPARRASRIDPMRALRAE